MKLVADVRIAESVDDSLKTAVGLCLRIPSEGDPLTFAPVWAPSVRAGLLKKEQSRKKISGRGMCAFAGQKLSKEGVILDGATFGTQSKPVKPS